jgi:hypothetical protein
MELTPNETFLQVGIGGLFVVQVLRMIFDFLPKMRGRDQILTPQLLGSVVANAVRQEATPLLSTTISILREVQLSNQQMANNLTILTRLTEIGMEDNKEIANLVRSEGDVTRHALRDVAKENREAVERQISRMEGK